MAYKYNSKANANQDRTYHVHAFITMADVAHNHQHGILGVSGPEIPHGASHVHCIRVHTTYDPREDGSHWHEVDSMSSPAIDLPGGQHTHQFAGETSRDLGHRHSFNSVMDTAPDEAEDEYCDNDYRPKPE